MSRTRPRWLWTAPLLCLAVAALCLLLAGRTGARDAGEGDGDVTLYGDAEVADAPLTASADALRAVLSGEETTDVLETGPDTFLDDLGAAGAGDSGRITMGWSGSSDLVDTAACVLRAYDRQGAAELVTSGYLDLQGNVWGALVQDGRGWVDVVMVADMEGGLSQVRIVRLLARASEQGFG